MGPSHAVFQGYSRSSEPTAIDRLSMTSYDYGRLSHTVSNINGDFCRKSHILTTGVLNAPAEGEGFPWNFITAAGRKILECWPYRMVRW